MESHPRRWMLLCACWLLACGSAEPADEAALHGGGKTHPDGPPGARWSMVDDLREARDLVRDPSDGGGRAWLERAEPEAPRASTPGRFTLVYEAGPLGVATGGSVFLQVSPFWGWSTPQPVAPDAPGYTTVTPEPDDLRVEARTLDQQLLEIRNFGRPLVEGDRLRIVYGDGEIGAIADRYAEARSRFWIAVDGDGDGSRSVIPDSPSVRVRAGPPAQLLVTLPSVARPGQDVEIAIAVLDRLGNRGVDFEGEIALSGGDASLELPAALALDAGAEGVARVVARALEPGLVRIEAIGPDGLRATSNPLQVSEEAPRILWGDLHGHSALSDGTGTPEDYFRYARDVAALDVVSLTDHDHWGMLPLETHPDLWKEIRAATRSAHEPGRFVTILGYEWTSWIHGHRHVLYFQDDGKVYSSVDEAFESPLQLWEALAADDAKALTFAHHSAGGPIPTNWEIPPDPRFEPVTEIASVHGSSEAEDSPVVIYSAVRGNFVRDVLVRGYRLGFVGSGDTHDGHPGLGQLASPSSGMAAILAEDLTREAVLEALRARRSYATNGPRILLRVALGAHRMGETIRLPAGETLTDDLYVHVSTTRPLQVVELIRSGAITAAFDGGDRSDLTLQLPVEDLAPGEWLYVRVIQEGSGAAWSSPIFIE